MEGWKYVGPFDELPAEQESGAKDAHRIILWGEVSELEGTGIVHIAPGCGKEDFELSKKFGLPQVVPLDEFGIFVEGFGWLTGKHVYKTQHLIVEDLRSKGLLFKVEDYIHRYPVCWRCSSELVFRVVDEWFISMGEKLDKPLEEVTDDDKEKNLRYQVINSAKEVRWIPSFGLQQELNWLLNMSDWMISKKRYWGLVLPIWECQKCGNFEVIGSEEELRERAVEGWEEFKGHTPHRPWVDAVKIRCPKCGSIISRIPDVGNPWLDAGIIAYSTLNYRHDRRYWKSWFPADLITECWPGQFRNWFYSMLTMSTIMERKTPFRTCLGHGLVLAEDGREMHKSWGNVIWFDDAVEKMGADIMRWMYCKTRPENNVLFGYTKAEETRRQFFVLLWNIYRFFVTYANFDEWTTDQTSENFSLLDRWILSKLQNLVRNITVSLEECAAAEATSHFEDFVGVLSTWYIRRSRRRFRKNKADEDKKAAYTTLYTCLTTLIKLLAPFLPFITEEMYQNLVLSINFDAPVSIHHHDWPREEPALTENQLVENMDLVIRASSLGRAVRSISGVKLRHPLREAMIVAKAEVLKRLERFTDLIRDELNVRRVSLTTYEQALIKYDVKLLPSKLGKKYGAMFPKLEEAIAQIPIEALVSALQERKSVDVKIGTGVVTLLPDEIEIQKMAREGYEIAEEEGLLVGLDMVIDEELAIEGLVRDIVRRIQNQRKDAGLEFADCAEIYFQADPRLAKAFKAHEDYIAKETLSIAIHNKPPPERAYVADYNLGGESLRIGLVRLDTQGTGSKLGRVNLRSN